MGRLKFMPIAEFGEVLERRLRPVVLQGDAIPTFLGGVPDDLCHGIIASGELLAQVPYRSRHISHGNLIGGIDVYRYAPDDPVLLNQDHYSVVACLTGRETLFVDGPFKDPAEHWLDEIPVRYRGIEVVGTTKTPTD